MAFEFIDYDLNKYIRLRSEELKKGLFELEAKVFLVLFIEDHKKHSLRHSISSH